MPQTSTENLAALLGSRICHDLISPIGAVSNGLELLSLSGVPDSPELSLVADSAANASARISLFRLAFGLASEDQITRRDEICDIWPKAMAGRRLNLDWDGPDSLPRPVAQVIVLALLCLDKALPQGGSLGVSGSKDNWALSASAPIVKVDSGTWEALRSDPGGTIDPANVQFLLLPHYLSRMHRTCRVDFTDDRVTISF